jgi:tape measure domain-containing protein
MAKNIGTFTAAGVDLKTATASIKGISNLAALSGSSAEQASTAMYQLSQAISAGKVGLQDWNSVVNAGMGGSAFQRALATTAANMGALKDGAVKLKGPMKNVSINGQSFRESIMAKPGEQSWLTSDVLTETLKQFTGDMTDAQLKAKGFSDEQIKAIQATAKSAQEAATNVKTLGQVFDVAKETMGSGWSQTWQTIFGDFGEAKKLFTGLSNGLNGIINDNANARNAVLAEWKKLGGREDLIAGLKEGFKGLQTIIAPLRDAWHEIFPPTTGAELADLTRRFRDLMESVKIGPDTADNLKRSFKGLFALLDIGKQILGGIFTAIGHMLGAIGDGSGGILNFSGNLGDLIVKLDEWLKKGDKIHSFFAGLGDVLGVPLSLIGKLTGALGGLFGGGDKTAGVSKSLSGMGTALRPATEAVNAASGAWDKFLGVLEKVKKLAAPIIDAIGQSLGNVGQNIADSLSNQNFDSVFQVLQTGLIAGIFLAIKKALGGGLNVDIGGGV